MVRHAIVCYRNLDLHSGLELSDAAKYLDGVETQTVTLYSHLDTRHERSKGIEHFAKEQGWSFNGRSRPTNNTVITVDVMNHILLEFPDVSNLEFIFFLADYDMIPLFNELERMDIKFVIVSDRVGHMLKKYTHDSKVKVAQCSV